MKVIIEFFYRIFRRISDWLKGILVRWQYPAVHSFSPHYAYTGSVVEIEGSHFGPLREDNEVTIGGVPARVIEAGPTRLKVISAFETLTGKIKVKVGGREGSSGHDFTVKAYPSPGDGEDGPPILLQGDGFPVSGDVPPTGNMRILVCLVNPTDRVPANPTNARNTVVTAWNNVSTFYNQVSYGTLTAQIDVFNNWHTLSGNFNDYVDTGIDNLRQDVLSRIMAEAAKHGQDEGWNLNNYQMIACVVNLNGTFIRAWGGSSTNNFRYDPLSINITTTNAINELWIQESANWGRCAHETGHNIVAAPPGLIVNDDFAEQTLGEDIYASDLIDPSVASAQDFDMMGNHDSHPMFTAYHMEKTGWYDSTNIKDITWDRNPTSHEYEIVAHGTVQDTIANRYHLLKIKVGAGLFYYVEVRQRPGVAAEYIYDTQIPVSAGDGGVVVTKVMTDMVNNNQQMRFISLLHDNHVLRLNDTAEDIARTLKITVVNDNVSARPLVCRVRVEWAQNISDTPDGQFDLRVEPWDSNFQTPDIWIDRDPFGVFDKPNDSQGRPQGNGDKPRPQEINKYYTRIHNDGTIAVNNVKVTFYAISPPGVGDNGNWSPIRTETISSINNNSFEDIFTNWVPVLGKHTCLKVFVSRQAGEISGGNNSAQENVFDFEAPAASVPQPVYIPLAVRNPSNERRIVHVAIRGVKAGYVVQFPHEWVWLDPLEEKHFEVTVVPHLDYPVYAALPKRFKQESNDYASRIRVTGYLARSYHKEIAVTGFPGSKLERIGGIFANVKPKKKVEIRLDQENRQKEQFRVTLSGHIVPKMAGQSIRVNLYSPLFSSMVQTTSTDGGGFFKTAFDLRSVFEALLKKGKVTDYEDFIKRANLTARAFVFDAAEAAEAESNTVSVVL